MDPSAAVQWLTPAEIELPLRRMVGSDARLSGDWYAEQFKTGQGDTLGVWRVTGTMDMDGASQGWSMVLKGWNCKDSFSSPTSFNWPWREAELYSSGLLNNVAEVSAPTCFHSVGREDSVWVWLEDLTTVPQVPWTLDHYALAGRLLGRFNGTYLAGSPLPPHRSYSKRWLAGWTEDGEAGIAMLDQYRQHPAVQQTLPPDVLSAILYVWSQRHSILDRLEDLPQTFCHMDAFQQNVFFRNRNGDDEMVLIDWSFAGWGAVGEELAALCMASAIFDPDLHDTLEDIERTAFDAYISGLRESGWNDSVDSVWHTYRSAAMLRYGPAPLTRMLPIMTNEAYLENMARALGVSVEALIERLMWFYQWLADHAHDIDPA